MLGGETLIRRGDGTASPRPDSAGSPSWLRPLLPALAWALLLAAVAGWGLWGFSYDDAFITYRYAEHLSRGEGLVYNAGERVLGTTAPGWAVVLAAVDRTGRAFGLDPDGLPPSSRGDGGLDVAGWGTLLCLASLVWLTAVLPCLALRRAPPPWPWAYPALLATLALLAPWNLQLLGAETFPLLALGVTAAWLVLDPARPRTPAVGSWREVAAGLLMAAAMVLRLDAALGAAAVGLVLVAVGWRGTPRRLPWRYAVAGLGPVALWLAALSAKFGTFLPHTLAGKRSEAAFAGSTGWLGYTTAEARWLLRDLPAWAAVLLVLAALAGLALLVWRGWPRAASDNEAPVGKSLVAALPLVTALLLWVVFQEIAYRVVGVPFAPWYGLPLLLAALALAAYAALAAATAVSRRALPAAPAVALPLAALLLVPVWLPGARWLAATWCRPPDVRTAIYGSIGDWLRENSGPTDVVAAVEIGALGYVSERPVLDLMGLVTPDALAARRDGQLPGFVSYRSPKYVVVPPHFRPTLLDPVLTHPDVSGRYHPIARFDHPAFTPGPIQLYECRTCP